MKKFFLIILVLAAFSSCSGQTEAEREEAGTRPQIQSQSQTTDISAAAASEAEMTLFKAPKQYVFDAHYIRTDNSISENAEHPAVSVISSRDELSGYFNKLFYETDDSRTSESRISNGRYSFFLDSTEKYSDDYFRNNYLIAVSFIEISGSIRHRAESVSENGDIIIRRFLPEWQDQDMACWSIIIELRDNKNIPSKWNAAYIDEHVLVANCREVSYAWDLSELMFVQDYIKDAKNFEHEATVISLDGTVKKIDFTAMPEVNALSRDEYDADIYFDKCNEIIMNCMEDDGIPKYGNIGPIPGDIIDLINKTGYISLISRNDTVGDGDGRICTYIAAGDGDERRLIKIGECGNVNYFAADVKVSGLYERICEYAGFAGW